MIDIKSSVIAAANIDFAAKVLSNFNECNIATVKGTAVAENINQATIHSLKLKPNKYIDK